jgi:topoisomerase-4 subunit A
MLGLDGLPKVKGLKEILTEWLEYRRDVVIRCL